MRPRRNRSSSSIRRKRNRKKGRKEKRCLHRDQLLRTSQACTVREDPLANHKSQSRQEEPGRKPRRPTRRVWASDGRRRPSVQQWTLDTTFVAANANQQKWQDRRLECRHEESRQASPLIPQACRRIRVSRGTATESTMTSNQDLPGSQAAANKPVPDGWKAELAVFQCNVTRSRLILNLLLRDKTTQQRDIVAIQEPWWNSKKGLTHHLSQAKKDFHLVFDQQTEKAERPKVAMYINKRISSTLWSLAFQSHLLHPQRIHEPGKEGGQTGMEELKKPENPTSVARTWSWVILILTAPVVTAELPTWTSPQFIFLLTRILLHL